MVDDVKGSAEHDNIGVVVGKAENPESNDITPLGELALLFRVFKIIII